MQKFIVKTLDYGVKLASLAITGPATWAVSGELFHDVTTPLILLVMRLAAVFLVEGVMLSNWLLLEFDKTANDWIKTRYGLTALAMYAGMLWIGIQHDGALVGIVFRLALLAALIGSGWDTYVTTWQRMTASIDRSPENSGKVKRTARELAIAESIHRRRRESQVTYATIDIEADAQLHEIKLRGERLLKDIRVTDREERARIAAKEARVSETEQKAGFPYPIDAARESLREKTRLSDEQLRERIAETFAVDGKYPRTQLAEDLGVGSTKLYDLINEMRATGLLQYDELAKTYSAAGNGNGHHDQQ